MNARIRQATRDSLLVPPSNLAKKPQRSSLAQAAEPVPGPDGKGTWQFRSKKGYVT